MRSLAGCLKEWEEWYEVQEEEPELRHENSEIHHQVKEKEKQELWHAGMSDPEYYALTMSSYEHWYGSDEDGGDGD